MKNKNLNLLMAFSLTSLMACSQNHKTENPTPLEEANQTSKTLENEAHNFIGWYCPDNLNGFPAVDLKSWKNVPTVAGRLPTEEETKNGTSLIFVDAEKYPNAKSLDLSLPQLARFRNIHTKREELIIVIQAIQVGTDSIVGFRYLNGGNGSASINEVDFISEQDVELPASSKFVSYTITIDTSSNAIWDVLRKTNNNTNPQKIFDHLENQKKSKVVYEYSGSGQLTASFSNILFGNYYIQNDFDSLNYTEKYLLIENNDTKHTELKLVCGPFGDDYEKQRSIITTWAERVKALSEKGKTKGC